MRKDKMSIPQNPLITDHLRNFFIEEKRTRMAKILVGLMISY